MSHMVEIGGDELAECLLARALMYGSLQALFAFGPKKEVCEVAASGDMLRALDVIGAPQEAKNAWRAAEKRLLSGAEEKLHAEHTRLFDVGDKYQLPLWASVYLSTDRVTASEHTIWARRMYEAYGYTPEAGQRVIADSLELELDFLAQLALRMADEFEAGETVKLERDAKGSLAFLSDHLLRWLPRFVERACRNEKAQLYYDISDFLLSFARYDASWLKEQIDQ